MTDKTPISEKAISVTELNATIKACVEAPVFHGLEVYGEVSGARMSGPHLYFTLKDKESQIACVKFGADRSYIPKDGESVVLRGSMNFWTKGGRLTFAASTITPAGKGLLAIEFERLKARLNAEGLFDEAHKVPIPKFASDVLVVTSRTGAVIRDIVTTVRRKNPVINITVRDVRVQGEGAAHEIAGVLARVDRLGYDVIVIARGGGSLEDLAPFYDEELVRAIYAMKTPVVSAIGHETDFSLADLVADARAATPTAAAELVAYDYYALADTLGELAARMKRSALRVLERKAMRARAAGNALGRQMVAFHRSRENRLRTLALRMKMLAQGRLRDADAKLGALSGKLGALDPLKVLSRGYFNLQAAGKSVTSVRSLKEGDIVTARGSDGEIEAEVKKVTVRGAAPNAE